MAPVDIRDNAFWFFISTVTKSSLGSISWATVLISSHLAMWETQCGLSTLPANTRHWPNAGPILAPVCDSGPATNQHWFNALCLLGCEYGSAFCWRPVQADTNPMYVKCWVSLARAGQYSFIPSQYFMLAVPAFWRYWHDALNQSWVNVGLLSVTLGQRLVLDSLHDRKRWTEINETLTDTDSQTERTEVKQHVSTSVYRGGT